MTGDRDQSVGTREVGAVAEGGGGRGHGGTEQTWDAIDTFACRGGR